MRTSLPKKRQTERVDVVWLIATSVVRCERTTIGSVVLGITRQTFQVANCQALPKKSHTGSNPNPDEISVVCVHTRNTVLCWPHLQLQCATPSPCTVGLHNASRDLLFQSIDFTPRTRRIELLTEWRPNSMHMVAVRLPLCNATNDAVSWTCTYTRTYGTVR